MTPMMLYAAFAALLVLGCALGVLPPLVTGRTDSNSLIGVTLRPPADTLARREIRAAVLAQELAEWLLKWLVALALAALPSWLLAASGLAMLIPLAVLACHVWPRLPGMQRQLELIGHQAEILVAQRSGAGPEYALMKARMMQNGYAGLFGGEPDAALVAAMARRSWIAAPLVAVNSRRIAKLSR